MHNPSFEIKDMFTVAGCKIRMLLYPAPTTSPIEKECFYRVSAATIQKLTGEAY
jgi:hypothetical protein